MTWRVLQGRFEDRWLALAFAMLASLTCAPIWLVEYLPLLDLPNHLAAVAVWHYHDDPRWDFARFYDLNLVPLPYWAHYYSVHLLTYVVRSVEVANKIFLTGYALALPLGALALARRFGRSPWLCLFAFPLIWNFNLGDGFIAYCAGFAAVPFALVIVDRHCEAPSWPRALAVVVVGSSTYFFHLLAYVLFLVCAGVVVLVQREALRPKRLLLRGLPVASCAGIGAWALARADRMNFHRLDGGARELVRDSLPDTLAQIPDRLINLLPGHLDEVVLVVLIASWLALALTARGAPDESPRARGLHGLGLPLCFVAAFLLFVELPRSMHRPFYWHMINGRFVVACALFLALSLRGTIAGWRRLLLAPVVVATAAQTIALVGAFRTFNRHAAGFDEVVARIPRGKQVMTLILRPMNEAAVNVSAFNQFAAYVQLRHGGYNFYNFAEGFPLRYRVYLPAPPWSHCELFDFRRHADGWDYFLTFREGWEYRPMDRPVAEGKLRLVAHAGEWRLYQKVAEGSAARVE